jgi:hypothetical protein
MTNIFYTRKLICGFSKGGTFPRCQVDSYCLNNRAVLVSLSLSFLVGLKACYSRTVPTRKRTIAINSCLAFIFCFVIASFLHVADDSKFTKINGSSTYRFVVKHTNPAVEPYCGSYSCCHILGLCAVFKIWPPTRPLVMMMH